MPANLTPEYRAAEAAFRKARDPSQRLEWLREMLRVIPNHKGTDHLQGDIQRRIKELSAELERPKAGGAHGGPALVVRPEGAAQIALLGPPNARKSSLHRRLTGSDAQVAPYRFTTQYPEPGMMLHEGIRFQLLDLPAVSPEHPVPWLASTLQTADACLLVMDLAEPAGPEEVAAVHAVLRERRVTLLDRWESAGPAAEGNEDAFALRLPTLLVANKADRVGDAADELRAFLELTGLRYPAFGVSAATGHGLGEIGPWLFNISASCGSTPSCRATRPIAIGPSPFGEARPWRTSRGSCTKTSRARCGTRASGGTSGFDGQQVGSEHPLADGDVVELHA